MRKIISLIVFCAPLFAQESPCTDSIFVKIKEVGFENLTEREFEYYKIKSNECEEYKNRELMREQIKAATKNNNSGRYEFVGKYEGGTVFDKNEAIIYIVRSGGDDILKINVLNAETEIIVPR